jgi:hypothetical protein
MQTNQMHGRDENPEIDSGVETGSRLDWSLPLIAIAHRFNPTERPASAETATPRTQQQTTPILE